MSPEEIFRIVFDVLSGIIAFIVIAAWCVWLLRRRRYGR
jgi:ribose/xylose/arabinose/galactoside ABC-type transport system permease subunit